MIGEVIAGYRIEAAIGAELHGYAYRARHPESNETVAIKVFAPETAKIPGGLDGLFNELRASSLIKQPGLVRIIDCDNPPGRAAYLIREDLKGESLRDCLNRVGSFSKDLEAIRNIVTQTARALSAAHAMALFHHCLSPETIFLTTALGQVPPFQIKLTEFGMGRFFQRQLNATMSGLQIPVAHLRYCSPEQIRGAESDQRADIYSLGCILYELLTGRRPFDEPTMADMFMAHVTKRAPTLLRLSPGTPPGLGELVDTMLEKDPAQRPFCMDEITAAINGILGVPQHSRGAVGVVDDRTTMFLEVSAQPSIANALAQPRPAPTQQPTAAATTNLPQQPIPTAEAMAPPPVFEPRFKSGERQNPKPILPPTVAAPKSVGPGLPEVGGTQVLLAVRQEAHDVVGLASNRKKASSRSRSAPSREGIIPRRTELDTPEDPPPGVFNQRRNLIIITAILLAGIAVAVLWAIRPNPALPTPPSNSRPIEQEASPPAKLQADLKLKALPPPIDEPPAPLPPPPTPALPPVQNKAPAAPKKPVRTGESGPPKHMHW